MSGRNPEAEKMLRLLCTRVFKRKHSDGCHYRLDMRVDGLSGKRCAIRDPRHPRWPQGGRVARTKAEALAWVGEYVDRLGLGWCRGTVALRTFKEHGEAYLTSLAERKGRNSSLYRNHRSRLRVHVYPKLGSRRTLALGETAVQGLIDEMSTEKGTPPSVSLQHGTLAAITAVWDHVSDGRSAPWEGKITIRREDINSARRRRAQEGERRFDEASGYSVEDLRWILIAALAVDMADRNNSQNRRGLKNCGDLVAFLIHHIVRIEEVRFSRAKDVKDDLRAVLIAGTKSKASEERINLTQRAYEPWLRRLRAKVSDPEHFLLPTSNRTRLPSHKTYAEKVARVLEAAGLKRPGDLTHIFRISHSAIALPAIGAEAVAAFSGRRIVGDAELSDHYFRWLTYLDSLPESHWDYFPNLGTPEELEAEAEAALRTGRIVVPPSRTQRRRRRPS